MYRTFKSILTRPVGDPLLDKFQRDVVDALKGFVLTSYSKNDVGLVPEPGTDDGSQILFDYGWGTFSFAGALHTHVEADVTGLVADLASKVPTTRNLSVTAPITGGGDLSSDRSFGFDTTANLDNNARIAVRRNSGGVLGTRRRLNFIEGANITIAPIDDAGSEEVDITISATGGGSSNTGITTVNFGAWPGTTDTTTVITGQAGIVAGSIVKVYTRLDATADHTADEHWVEDFNVYAGSIVAGTGFTIYAISRSYRLYGEFTVAWEWV